MNDSPAMVALARGGYVASGILHLMLALIVVQIAWFGSSASADQSGALGALAANPTGRVVLWVLAAGFAGLALWQVTEAIGTAAGAGARMKAVAKTVVYAVLAWSALRVAQGVSSSSGTQSRDATATLMARPGGRIAVAVVGLVVVGVGVYHVRKGWTRGFRRDLAKSPGRFVDAAGRWGYVAKGIALVIVGGLFVVAAQRSQPAEAGGLDAALRTLGGQPFGTLLLTLVAAGLAGYGVYSFFRARYARI